MKIQSIVKLSLIVIILSAVTAASAIPPSKIEAIYDFKVKVLFLKIDHVTNNVRDHHIRKIVIIINGKETKEFFSPTQTNGAVHLKEIPISLQLGDQLAIKVSCNKSGPKEISYTVPSQ